jgi:hypothetical protein
MPTMVPPTQPPPTPPTLWGGARRGIFLSDPNDFGDHKSISLLRGPKSLVGMTPILIFFASHGRLSD